MEYVTIGELENDLMQIDDDLLSMEYPKFFSSYFLVNKIFLFLQKSDYLIIHTFNDNIT